MPYLTPYDLPVCDATCRQLFVPAQYLPVVVGALTELTKYWNWEYSGDTETVQDAVDAMLQMVESLEEACMGRAGEVSIFAGPLPDGVLACDGSTYDLADYPDLVGKLDASLLLPGDQFLTPDLRSRVVIGAGQGAGMTNRPIGISGGAETVTLTTSQMPTHSHLTHTHLSPIIVDTGLEIPLIVPATKTPAQTGNAGLGTSHENTPAFTAWAFGLHTQ